MLGRAFERPLFRYIFIGGLTYIIDIAILIGLYAGLHTSRALAASASFWAGLLISFLLQKLVAFQDYQKEIRAISKQVVWYAILVAFNYALTVVIVSFFPGRYIVLSRTIALAITTCWNFVVYRRLVFKSSPEKEPL